MTDDQTTHISSKSRRAFLKHFGRIAATTVPLSAVSGTMLGSAMGVVEAERTYVAPTNDVVHKRTVELVAEQQSMKPEQVEKIISAYTQQSLQAENELRAAADRKVSIGEKLKYGAKVGAGLGAVTGIALSLVGADNTQKLATRRAVEKTEEKQNERS